MRKRPARLRPATRPIAAGLAALGLLIPALADDAGQTPLPEPARAAPDGPIPADRAAASFRLAPGLRIELVAAEPMVISPVALAFDERGRLFVAENRGYPTGPAEGEPPVGRVAMLEDTDGDGRMDRRTEFAEGLTFPNGVMPWDGGLIVTCAPDVLWLRDTDGDGRADERRVLFTGFSTAGSTQLRVSHPTLSVDNWVYLTSGLTGGKVVSPRFPDRPPVELRRTDFRFRPGADAWEAADGGAQFGLTFDDFGRRFICYNRVQVQHVAIDSKTLRHNPHLAFSDTVQNCPADTVPEPLKGHGAAARLFPISTNVTTADSHAGTFTAACAVTVYRGTGLPDSYRGGAFSCDPTGNLVHFDRLEPAGATFAAHRVHDGFEFLASTNSWFRPVFLAHGPDGALYIADMYRATIEHPDYLPVEIRKRTDFSGGKTMGRIWRVVRDDADPAELARRRRVDLASASTAQLCTTLREPDGWRRDAAHRLLLLRRDPGSVGPLRDLAGDPAAPAASVVHALHLLDAQGALTDDQVRAALAHPAAPVREHAVQLVEARLPAEARWLDDLIARAGDDDARVRFRVAIALGGAADSEVEPVAAALARIAARDGSDRWLRAAAFSSMTGRELSVLEQLARRDDREPPLSTDLLVELGRLLGASRPRESWPEVVRLAVAEASGFAPEERAALLTGLAGAVRGKLDPAGGDTLTALLGPGADEPALAGPVRELVGAMSRTALDPATPEPARRAAVGLLAFADYEAAGPTLLALIEPAQPAALQAEAVRALGSHRDDRVAAALLEPARFAAFTPSVREEVLSSLVTQSHHLPGLLAALERGAIPVGSIDALRRRQLTQHRDASIQARAQALFGAVPGDRAAVYEAHKGVLDLPSDAGRGRAVFRRECASCHRLDREGHPVGPDLFGIRNQPKEAILLHVLAPDLEITQGFAAYSVATRDGRVLTGLIASETPNSLTLRQPLGQEATILRDEVEEITAGAQSLMPQGLEKTINHQEFADLLAYLKGEGPSSQESAP